MGVIIRQGLKASIVNFTGIILGVVSTLFIYPLDLEIYGFIQFLFSSAFLFMPFCLFGINEIAIRYFPYFKTEDNKHNHLLGNTFLLSFILFTCLIGPLFVLLYILKIKFHSVEIIYQNLYKIAPILFFISISILFERFSANFKSIVTPRIFTTLLPKLTVPSIILASLYFSWINEHSVHVFIVILYIVIIIGLLLHIKSRGHLFLKPKLSVLTKSKYKKEIIAFVGTSAFIIIGRALAFKIDSIMVTSLMSEGTDITKGAYLNGIYSLFLFISNTLQIPSGIILTISAPIVANSFKNNDLTETNIIYKKSSTILLIAGLTLFFLIWINMEDILHLTSKPEELISYKYCFFFLAIGWIIELGTSINGHYITYSKYYKFNLIALLLMGVSNIFMNYLLIKHFDMGIIGASLATCIALLLYNIAKLLFIYYKFKVTPFSKHTPIVISLCLLVGIITYYVHIDLPNTLLNIGINSITFLFLLAPLIYWSNASEDLNNTLNKFSDTALEFIKKNL